MARVKRQEKSINIYDKNKYKAVENGFIQKVSKEWNEILKDSTVNRTNYKEVLEKKGIYTKEDKKLKQIYFTADKKNFDKRHSKKVLTLYNIASTFDYQFKTADETNFFDYDISMKLLERELSYNLTKEKEINYNKGINKSEEELELEKTLKKELIAEETESLKLKIREYIEEENKEIKEIYKMYNVDQGKNFKTEIEVLNEDINEKISKKRIEAIKDFASKVFKNIINYWEKEGVETNSILKKVLNVDSEKIDRILEDNIKKKLGDYPNIDNINNKEDIDKIKENIELIRNYNKKTIEDIGKKEFFTDYKKEILENVKKKSFNNISLLKKYNEEYSEIAGDKVKNKIDYINWKETKERKNDFEKTFEITKIVQPELKEDEEIEEEETKEEVKKVVVEEKRVTKAKKTVLEDALEATIQEREKLLKEQLNQEKEKIETEDIKKKNQKEKEIEY